VALPDTKVAEPVIRGFMPPPFPPCPLRFHTHGTQHRGAPDACRLLALYQLAYFEASLCISLLLFGLWKNNQYLPTPSENMQMLIGFIVALVSEPRDGGSRVEMLLMLGSPAALPANQRHNVSTAPLPHHCLAHS
jgi:hypothetical protein